ncbi:MAG: Nif3-like dinuclear metal center hexameric protein [Ruminococcus sp.]|uniref:Nif3-like dinuclear metal center hexameric protein n=1 Tax=Ruminococcus sp. TaxID=41978 RepID=UPI001B0E0053|nr:Nif3-like dinuclear metal center hexameric protein [Ruminococcus sp.]MBO7475196.1 Nif3-like dinuclear metal center hexameric protein [Ruminococcus sp.]
MLDNRLKKIAELVSGEGIAVDVGTDHAYLAAELINSGKCSKVIASDVKDGPLSSARSTVEKYGIQDRVELILSDGLENVPHDGVSDIVIAGMGGETIAAIIEDTDMESFGSEDIHWILQPMTKPDVLRKKLNEYGFIVWQEYAVEEADKLYLIMEAQYNPYMPTRITEAGSICGFFAEDDPVGEKYRVHEAQKLEKISISLAGAGDRNGAQHYSALACKLRNGIEVVKISDIKEYLDSVYPFSLQEKWDNSGYLVESAVQECERVVLALDITNDIVDEAFHKEAELIISHHPVIFEPRRRITRNDPVYRLIESGIGALCMHTNLDIAIGGTNGVILEKLSKRLDVDGEPEFFEELGGDKGLGWIISLKEDIALRELATICKDIFGCEYVRTTHDCGANISRIALCSGSGGSMLGIAAEKDCDALITGDVKHDVWIDAANCGISLLDCGHFHTENIVLWELRRVLEERFPQLDVEIAECSTDPCEYV